MMNKIPKNAFTLHAKAPNTRSGNPNRAYFICTKEDGVIAALDEGYEGYGVLYRELGKDAGQEMVKSIALDFPTEPKFVKEMLDTYGPNGSRRQLRLASDDEREANKSSKSSNRSRRGMTLAESMIVAAIFGILGIIAVAGIRGCVAGEAQKNAAESEAAKWAQAMSYKLHGRSCADIDSDNDGYVSCTVDIETNDGRRENRQIECRGAFSWGHGCRDPKLSIRSTQ